MDYDINNYLEEITTYLKVNSLLIFPQSLQSRCSPRTHPIIHIEDSQLPLVQCPKISGIYLDTPLSFNKHSGYVTERVSIRNHIHKVMACTSRGQQKEKLLMTYNAVERTIINYAAPVWNRNLRDTTETTETSNIHRTRL